MKNYRYSVLSGVLILLLSVAVIGCDLAGDDNGEEKEPTITFTQRDFTLGGDAISELYMMGDFTNWSANEDYQFSKSGNTWSLEVPLSTVGDRLEYNLLGRVQDTLNSIRDIYYLTYDADPRPDGFLLKDTQYGYSYNVLIGDVDVVPYDESAGTMTEIDFTVADDVTMTIDGTTHEIEGVYLMGNFNGWDPEDPAYAFTHNEAEGRYELTAEFAAGSYITYKHSYDLKDHTSNPNQFFFDFVPNDVQDGVSPLPTKYIDDGFNGYNSYLYIE
ncbi:hypothetical protein [Spirochaeta africana]|uniref:Uncharacterized protein n=1 Tax=Spirochaeta africana (strain ATCC 700263 / DSM 8902 / Z-7692) TaxID=889378 RepID=H9UJW8_SPIAZ|nr:hypothetical protein [Spirochaeta africana]AFG37811.1 hypothetical protein Spiaf_1754 [Spirochaeta africana DSM 8902]